MKYFVTGSSGFIGQHVCRYLEKKGHEVIKVMRGGIPKITTEAFTVIHLGAYGNHATQDESMDIVDANICWLWRLCYMLSDNPDLVKFYNISTSSIHLPVQTLYSISKHFGEKMIEQLNDSRFVNVRPYSVFGPGEAEHRFIPTVIRHFLSGEVMELAPEASHDWIFVEDFVKAMFDGHTEIGTGESYSNMEIVRMLEIISGKNLNCRIVKGLRNYDTTQWKAPVGVPHISIKEGLKQTYEHFTQKNN